MIQLNLLPDLKLEYLKAQRSRRLVITASFLVTVGAIGILVLVLSFGALQTKHLNDINKDIATDSAKLKAQPDIDKILTVQNQLKSLTDLHKTKPAASRIFDFLNQLTPSNISISTVTVDFVAQTATVTGSADSLSGVNQYIDTIKYTKYVSEDSKTTTKAFSDVVLTSFSVSSAGAQSNQAASYTINFKYDPPVFDLTKKVTLTVPSLTTTRAVVNSPTDLFIPVPSTKRGN